ncbi:hypothetical protein CHS0354_020744 [Potamilus streckersoni]|uniref:Asl1-like glycosyl hydrolase catalytic domain-containing protein n=1 Tax=Potamilus streckersoni TaxID=2493646 RepID=A0AAE0SCA4_9BIVA|nr:hypothetical protein CHS0354_020744 [Potamilus streckersoni]
MVWGWRPHADLPLHISQDSEYVLGFNEPNFYKQANITPHAAVQHWAEIEAHSTVNHWSVQLRLHAVLMTRVCPTEKNGLQSSSNFVRTVELTSSLHTPTGVIRIVQ